MIRQDLLDYPKVSIIILNWNGLKDTIKCLESLKKITYLNYEVIIVDNGSKGNDVEVLSREFGDYIYIIKNDKNYGFTKGNNIGIRLAFKKSADYILLLNNDTVVRPNFLSGLVKIAESNPRIGIVGPKILNFDGSLQFSCWKYHSYFNVFNEHLLFNFFGNAYKHLNIKNIREVDVVSGACMLFRKKVFDKVGLLDEKMFMYTEETDICYRAKKNGYKIIYYPDCSIIHYGGQSSKQSQLLNIINLYRSRTIFFRKHYSRFKALVLEKFLMWGLLERILLLNVKKFFTRNRKTRESILKFNKRLKWYKKERKKI